MATAQSIAAPEQRIVLYDVSWETYESLLADYEDKSSPRFTYDRGVLEIVSPTTRHEMIVAALETIVGTMADELGLDIVETRSTTFKLHTLQRGFEPDSSFYVQHAPQIAGKTQINLSVDPPPDLVIEIDISNPSLNKLPIYAAMGIPEIWRYAEASKRVEILRLTSDEYRQSSASEVLPPLTSDALTMMVPERFTLGRVAWKQRIREWIVDHR